MLNQEEYDKKEAMYNEALRDLCDLHYANGLHTGRWEDEFGRAVGIAEFSLPDGTYDGTVVTDSVHAIDFLLKNR